MKKIELYLEDLEEDGVFGISLVNNPAMESNFILLDKEDKQLFQMAKIDKKKNTITGIALIPNKMIKRKKGNELVEVYFSADTVKKISQNYLKNYYQFNTTVAHEKDVDDVFLTESWIVEDPELDKTKSIGLKDVKKGSWALTLKLENEEVLKQIEDGTYKGFSIEGFFSNKLTQLKKEEIEMKKPTLKERVMAIFDSETKEPVLEPKKDEVIEEPIKEEKVVQTEEKAPEIKDEKVKETEETKSETKEPIVEPKKDEVIEEPIKEDKVAQTEEKTLEIKDEEPTMKDDEPTMKDVMAILTKMQETNDKLMEKNQELEKKIDEKPIPSPKMSTQTDTVPQSYHARMNKILNAKRKQLGMDKY